MARNVNFPAQISALVSQEARDQIDALERTYSVSAGEVIREALAAGLPCVQEKYARGKQAGDHSAASTDAEYAREAPAS